MTAGLSTQIRAVALLAGNVLSRTRTPCGGPSSPRAWWPSSSRSVVEACPICAPPRGLASVTEV
jgi:hypothetical protein